MSEYGDNRSLAPILSYSSELSEKESTEMNKSGSFAQVKRLSISFHTTLGPHRATTYPAVKTSGRGFLFFVSNPIVVERGTFPPCIACCFTTAWAVFYRWSLLAFACSIISFSCSISSNTCCSMISDGVTFLDVYAMK